MTHLMNRVEGFDAVADERAGKRLRTHVLKAKPTPKITARELVKVQFTSGCGCRQELSVRDLHRREPQSAGDHPAYGG